MISTVAKHSLQVFSLNIVFLRFCIVSICFIIAAAVKDDLAVIPIYALLSEIVLQSCDSGNNPPQYGDSETVCKSLLASLRKKLAPWSLALWFPINSSPSFFNLCKTRSTQQKQAITNRRSTATIRETLQSFQTIANNISKFTTTNNALNKQLQ